MKNKRIPYWHSIGFEQYYKDYAINKAVKEVKAIQLDNKLEKLTLAVLSLSEEVTIKKTTPKVDISFGADFLVSYYEGDIQNSLFIDVTSSPSKSHTSYLKLDGTLTDDYKDCFQSKFSFGTVSLAIKERHASHFTYDKPVVVLVIRDYSVLGLSVSKLEADMLVAMLKTMNNVLVEKYGVSKRASMIIYPNPKRYPKED